MRVFNRFLIVCALIVVTQVGYSQPAKDHLGQHIRLETGDAWDLEGQLKTRLLREGKELWKSEMDVRVSMQVLAKLPGSQTDLVRVIRQRRSGTDGAFAVKAVHFMRLDGITGRLNPMGNGVGNTSLMMDRLYPNVNLPHKKINDIRVEVFDPRIYGLIAFNELVVKRRYEMESVTGEPGRHKFVITAVLPEPKKFEIPNHDLELRLEREQFVFERAQGRITEWSLLCAAHVHETDQVKEQSLSAFVRADHAKSGDRISTKGWLKARGALERISSAPKAALKTFRELRAEVSSEDSVVAFLLRHAQKFVNEARKNGKYQADHRALTGKKAPAFALKALDGTTRKLEDEHGKVVLLCFWGVG